MQLIYEKAHIQLYKGSASHGAYYIEHIEDIYLATVCIMGTQQKVLSHEYFDCRNKAIYYLKGWDKKIA